MRFSRTSKWNILLACIILLLSPNLLFADRTVPPTVESITGPTSGVVGNTYTFSTTVTSTESYPFEGVGLYRSVVGPDGESIGGLGIGNKTVGESGCTITSCIVTGQFTPTGPGAYYIFTQVNIDSSDGIFCSSNPEAIKCLDSTGKYITFVVTGEEAPGTGLPDTGIENIYISIIGILFIMIGVVIDRYVHPTRRETVFIDFEDKFKDK